MSREIYYTALDLSYYTNFFSFELHTVRLQLCIKTHLSRIAQHMEQQALPKWEKRRRNVFSVTAVGGAV